jgi:hypothetical protein
MKRKRCVVYHACCKSIYKRMAAKSARSAKRLMPDVDTVLITDLDIKKPPYFDVMIREEPVKLLHAHFPPLGLLPERHYDSGLYTGANSYFCRPMYDVFELVESSRTDMALVHGPHKLRYTQYPSPDVPEAWPHWRDALLCFADHPRMRKFFADWKQTFLAHIKKFRRAAAWEGPCHPNEPTFRIALYHSDLHITTLPPRYCTTLSDIVIRGDIKLIATPETLHPEELGEEANRCAPYPRLFKDGKTVQVWR